MNKHKKTVFILVLLSCFFHTHAQRSISLAGQWLVRLDSLNEGIDQQWYKQSAGSAIQLPGTLDDAGIGSTPTLTADKLSKEVLLQLTRKHTYIGAAWYSKEIVIPS